MWCLDGSSRRQGQCEQDATRPAAPAPCRPADAGQGTHQGARGGTVTKVSDGDVGTGVALLDLLAVHVPPYPNHGDRAPVTVQVHHLGSYPLSTHLDAERLVGLLTERLSLLATRPVLLLRRGEFTIEKLVPRRVPRRPQRSRAGAGHFQDPDAVTPL